MHIPRQAKTGLCLLSVTVILAGCSTNSSIHSSQNTSAYTVAELEQRNQVLVEREKDLARREAEAKDASMRSAQTGEELLPPNAKSGECYARVWVEPVYQNYTETVLAQEASERVEIIPARYETVNETVQVAAASYSMRTIPAKYNVVTEKKRVREAATLWRTDLAANSAPASQELLQAATNHGIDLDQAQPGMCFHEHYRPASFKQVKESVLVEEAYDQVSVVPAQYRWVKESVLVKEAGNRIEEVPAKYETVTEQVIDVPAHTTWKKGTGPIQKIDEATGEIMCLVDVPATYKAISKRVLVAPASSRTVAIPAEYKTVKVKQLVSDAREVRSTVPAVYNDLSLTKKTADASFVWHEVHDHSEPRSTRTGNKICLTATPARYKTVKRKVVVQEASSEKVEIPAKYKNVQVTKLVSAAQEKRHQIPAQYKTVSLKKLDREGFMEWRSILCETNMTTATILDIQRALDAKGFNPGPVDGVIGAHTIRAVNAFQQANSLPSDKYINMETVKALNVQL